MKSFIHPIIDYHPVWIIVIFTRSHFSLCCRHSWNNSHEVIARPYCDETLPNSRRQTVLTVYLELWALTLSLICRILFYSKFQFITDQNHTQLIKILRKVTKVITVRNYRHTWITWTECMNSMKLMTINWVIFYERKSADLWPSVLHSQCFDGSKVFVSL